MNNLIKLEKAYNIRHLGGYKNKVNKTIKEASFLRADCLGSLTDKDIEILLNFGLGTVIDLRSDEELKAKPNLFENHKEVNYKNIPLAVTKEKNLSQDLTKMFMENPTETMPLFYLDILNNSKDNIKIIFETMNNNLDKTILFHCTAGKDRTGIIAMLLLGLFGISKEEIIEDYIITFENNKLNPSYLTIIDNIPIEVLYSTREYILTAIEYIENNYNSYYDYLLSTGLSKEILDNIIASMTTN